MRKHKRKLSIRYGHSVDQYYINYVDTWIARMEAKVADRMMVDDAQSKAGELHAQATDLLDKIYNG
jgi:hypothetical protein